MNAYIGIGTNIGDRETNIRDAIKALNHLPKTKITDVSAVYETEPWGYTQQDNFYNICVKVETELSPEVLLGGCLGIEASMGRERPFKNAPRIIDIDLLLYEDEKRCTEELMLPHPLIGERAFVLIPLKDILPEMCIGDINYLKNYNLCEKTGVNRLFEINIEKD